ncbi:molybdopterin-guanine dinucleotide biosynthesis protein B [Paenibacillus tepidiphilus]|uniref:molybdopterin-guanine dinucleotide biosynthesis protein B n=1 Tax=Paenibacillus tepidiphilus TaxID=2608683 RepID=UPI00123B9C68|nr:molybdopterin-guanine dinucleotide biosynthesis protein B [Paenibacillus tepidiphilus]
MSGKSGRSRSRSAGQAVSHPAGHTRQRDASPARSRGTGPTTPPVCQIVGYKNSGKTTLICSLLPYLRERGCKVGVIKHDAHDFEADREHTDTWRHRQSGAEAVAITSPRRTAVIEERGSTLEELLALMSGCDYVLVEGFKTAGYPKLALIRSEQDLPLLEAPNIAAAAVWLGNRELEEAVQTRGIRLFGIDDTAGIAGWLWQQRYFFQNFNI